MTKHSTRRVIHYLDGRIQHRDAQIDKWQSSGYFWLWRREGSPGPHLGTGHQQTIAWYGKLGGFSEAWELSVNWLTWVNPWALGHRAGLSWLITVPGQLQRLPRGLECQSPTGEVVGAFVVLFRLLSHVQLFATSWTIARQTLVSFTVSQSLCKFMSIESMMLSNHLILSATPFSCLQSFPASGSFPISRLFVIGGPSIGASASASVLPMNI